jgi:hypothetical protein
LGVADKKLKTFVPIDATAMNGNESTMKNVTMTTANSFLPVEPMPVPKRMTAGFTRTTPLD